MKTVCDLLYKKSTEGASIYFMQREKNVDHVYLLRGQQDGHFKI
jgi:hypothetical protein